MMPSGGSPSKGFPAYFEGGGSPVRDNRSPRKVARKKSKLDFNKEDETRVFLLGENSSRNIVNSLMNRPADEGSIRLIDGFID